MNYNELVSHVRQLPSNEKLALMELLSHLLKEELATHQDTQPGPNTTATAEGGPLVIESQKDALAALDQAWPHIVAECRATLGSELYYQAVVYHCLRSYGAIPLGQLGMNVKMRLRNSQQLLSKKPDEPRPEGSRSGLDPIPDVVVFKSEIRGDWRRRNRENSLQQMVMAIEVKASERHRYRLTYREIEADIQKLGAIREEISRLQPSPDFLPVIMLMDTAPDVLERIKPQELENITDYAHKSNVYFYYASPTETRVVVVDS